ncbi:GNAT family N-acetyltransferase [Actomonas aquatica]|uniref:GNAT family N-acetyltransferase n=1 Tax=Actomonas aquatica TaxID=2866162 RepID=A0ABZ1C743_9BACT|nr:GNAT family N-acetyltransferase [Opitutus sp. WL0086]WRQ87552.1 GNAT family N-acetyltransferase [Opitutus sp. WL0086]
MTPTTPSSPADLAAYFDLRWRVLRQPWDQPRGSEQDDHDAIAFHLMLRDDTDGTPIAAGRLHEPEPGIGQVRYMAVADTHRGQGLGSVILRGLEAEAVRRGYRRLKLNARETAIPFYASNGFVDTGPAPTAFGIPHRAMAKEIGG